MGCHVPGPDKPSAGFQIQPSSPLQGPTRSPSSHSQFPNLTDRNLGSWKPNARRLTRPARCSRSHDADARRLGQSASPRPRPESPAASASPRRPRRHPPSPVRRGAAYRLLASCKLQPPLHSASPPLQASCPAARLRGGPAATAKPGA